MSIFSRLLRDSLSPTTLSDREKRLRRRRFLKGLEDHSRSMRMEQLEPRLLLAGDFFAADEWAIIKEGSTATTAEELPNSGSLDDGIYYLGVAPEDGPLDPAEAPIKVIATGAGYIGRAGGTEPLHFMDVKTYIKNKMEWELLFCGHFDLEEDETFTSELTVLNCSGGLDTLEIAGLAFEPSGIGFNQPGGEGRTQSALLQGELSVDVGPAILGGLQAFDGVRFGGVGQDYWDGITQLQFSIDENNYIKSNKDYGIFVSGTLENVIEQDKQVKIKTPWGPRIEIEDLAVSIDTTEMALKVQGEVEVEELPFLNEIRADLTGDNYISLDFAPGTPIEDRINIIGELTFDSTPAKGFDVVYGLNVNTIDGEWGASVDIDTKKIGQFKGEATFDGLELTNFRVEADPKRNIPVVAPYLYLDSGYIDVSNWNQTSTTYEVGTTFNIGPGLQIKLPEWAQSMFGVKKLKGALGQLDLSGTWQPSTNSFGATTDVKVLPVDIDDAEYSLVKQSGTFGGTWPHSLYISGAAQIPAKEVEGVPEDIAIISGSMAARIQGSRSGYNLYVSGNGSVSLDSLIGQLDDGHIKTVLQDYVGGPALDGEGTIEYVSRGGQKYIQAKVSIDMPGPNLEINWKRDLTTGETVDEITYGYFSISGSGESAEGSAGSGATSGEFHIESDPDQAQFIVTWQQPGDGTEVVANPEDWLSLTPGSGSPISAYVVDYGSPQHLLEYPGADDDLATKGDNYSDWGVLVEVSKDSISLDSLGSNEWIIAVNESLDPVDASDYAFRIGLPYPVEDPLSISQVNSSGDGSFSFDFTVTGDSDNDFDFDVVLRNSVDSSIEYSVQHDDLTVPYTSASISADATNHIPAGDYQVVVRITDANNSNPEYASQLFEAVGPSFNEVSIPDHLPVFASYLDSYPDHQGPIAMGFDADKTEYVPVFAYDVDGDAITSMSISGNSDFVEFDSVASTLTIVPNPLALGPYTEEFTVSATSVSGTTTQEYQITITPDFSPSDLLVGLNKIGSTINSYVSELNLPDDIPFVSDVVEKTVDYTQVFSDFAAQLVDDPQVTIPISYSGGNVTFSNEQFLLSINGEVPSLITLPDATFAEAEVADVFNQSLVTAGIDDLVHAVIDDGGTGDILIKPSMPATLQTLELSAAFVDLSMIFNPDFETGGGDWDGLIDDVPISFLLNEGLATEREYSIHLNLDGGETDFGTADNASDEPSDLISDINGLLELESAPRNLIKVAAIKDWVDGDELQRLIAYGGLSGEGFSATVSSLEVDVNGNIVTSTELTSPIAVSSTISSYTLKFNTVDELDSLLQDLTADFDWLDVGLAFDVNEFDPNKQALELSVNIQKELTAEVPFSYDDPIDLGFGNLEIVGEAIASANLIAGFNATIGFDITRGGMAMPISATTELGFLHQQKGVRIDAPIIAETPFNYMDAKNGFGFNLAIHGNYDDPAGTPLQSAISISAAQLASANSEVEALAMIGELLDAQLQDTGYEDALDVLLTEDGRFAIRNNSWMITKLEVSGAVNITNLGFSDNLDRESNATDLIISIDTEPATTLEVVLDGVRTLGDVIDRIEAADVDELIEVSIDPYRGLEIFSGDGFEVIAPTSEFPSIESMVDGNSEYDSSEAALTSTVVQLGLVGEGQLLESGFFLLEGTSLDSRNISQRVYFTEGTDAEPTLYIEEGSVGFEADLIAALGPLGASLHADGKVSLSASLNLEDPGLELPDGKLYLSELADASVGSVVGDPEFDFWVGQYGLANGCGGTAIPDHDHEPATINANITVGGEVVAEANVWMSTDCGIAIGDPGWFVVTTDLSSFEMKDLTIDQIIYAIQQGVDYLKDQDWDWLHQDLPLVNRSAADGLEFLDMVIDKVNGWIYELDLENLGLEFGEFRSFVFNLPNTDTEVSIPGLPDLDFDLEGLIKGKVNKGIDFLEQALALDEDRRLPRLVASIGYLRSLFDGWNIRFDTLGNMEIDIDFDGSGLKTLSYDHTSSMTAMFQDLVAKFDAIKLLIPSIENLIESLGPKVSLEVCEALLDSESCEIDNPFKIEFKFGDLDGDEANDAILIGMRYDPEGPILHERFTPHFDVADYGPVEIDIDGDALFTLDGFVQLSVGVGKEPGEAPEFFLITDGNAPIAPTSVQLSTSVTGDLNADIGFGALTALEGTIGLAIAEAKRVQIGAVDPATHSASLILDEDLHSKSEYLFVYNANGNLISSDEYEVDAIANTITFADSGVYSSQPLEVFYNLTSFDNPQPINVGVSITESSYSEALSPQPVEGLNAKLHLIAVSTNKAVPRSDYELVDDGGQIKIKAAEAGIEIVDSDGFYVYEQPSPIVETQPGISDGSTALMEVPLYGTNKNLNGSEDEQFIVLDAGSGEPAEFSLSYDGVDYVVNISEPGSYNISYPTRDTFFDGQGPATVYFDLNSPDTDPTTINALGGVSFGELSAEQLNLISNVFAIAAVDAEILGSSENDVAYAAGMMVGESGELADTEFEFRAGIDAEALNNMLSNIDFNLKTIIEGLEAFLELLETGMRDETLAKLPFIDPEDLTGPADFVQGLREGFVTPLKERLCKAGGQPLSVLEGELAGWIFSALGPGMTSDSIAFESLFADLASELESEPDWLIEDGLNLIDMSQFRFSNTQKASVGDVENVPQISNDKDVAFGELEAHLTAINAGDTYVYKKLGDDWLEIPIAKEDHYSFFKAIVPITFGEEGDKFEIGDIGNVDGATLVGGGTARIGNIPLGRTYSETVEFKNSLDSLPFEVQGEPEINFDLHFGFDLGVGVDKSSGFYFITNDEDSAAHQGKELEIGFEAALGEDSSMGIDLFGLMLQAENDGTELSASIGIDISDINTDDHLTLSEIGSNEFFDWFRPEIEFEAELGLVFSAGINSNIPSISTRLGADLDFEIYLDTSNQFRTAFNAGKFGFTDVQLDLGDFLTKTIGPILKEVDKVLDPVKPIVDFLTMEVPGISDASEFAGKGKVMVMDLAFSKDPEMGEKARKFVGVVQQIMDVVEMLASFEEGESMAIEFGSFEFDRASNPAVDMLNEPFPADLENTLDLSNVESAENVTEQANNGSNATVSAGFAKVDEDPGPLGLAGLGIQLDIIKDPMNIVKLLMGQTANLVSWDIPRFDLNFEYTKSFPIWATPPISLGIGADFGLFADFSVGMDTRFRQTGNFLDGFYFGDLEGVHTGADVAELGITIGARLRAALDLLIVSAGVEGELRADIEANWADTNNDGKMYLDEMANIIRQDGFGCLFEISGQLRALISIFYEVDVWFWSASGSKTLADILLYEFELEHCPKWNLAHVAENGEVEFETPGGDVLTSGTDWLIIHAGQFGDMRGGSSSDTHEYFELKGSETELRIEFNHGDVIQTMTTELDGIKTIYFDGGYGSDTLLLTGEDWGDIENILFDGGNSSDMLKIASPASLGGIALGGSGNDKLLVSAGKVAWELWGEAGDDELKGSSSAANAVFGGTGNDEIETGSKSDFVDGGAGVDEITTFGGVDYVYGGADADQIIAGDGDDQINAGPGSDTVYGGIGADIIYGAAGNDSLYGEDDADKIFGGSGNDYLDGAGDNDEIAGQDGDDILLGNDGEDTIAGGAGNDFLIGHDGADKLYGGFGDDVLIAHLLGDVDSTAPHELYGGPDDDYFCGSHGDDAIFGGTLINEDTTSVTGAGALSLDPVIGEYGGLPSLAPESFFINVTIPAKDGINNWHSSYSKQEFLILPADLENPPADIGGKLEKPICHVVQVGDHPVVAVTPELVIPVTTTSLTGFVYLDANEDQQRGDDESGIAEVVVQLQDREGEIVLETVSGEDGSYGFDNVDQGEYTIVQILDASGVYLQTSPPNEQSDENVYDVTVSANDQDFGSLDFGNALQGVKIEGRKLRIDSYSRYEVETTWFQQMVETKRNREVADFVPELALMSDVSPFSRFETLGSEGINDWEIYLYDTDWNLLDSTHTSSVERNNKEGIQPEERGWYEFDHLPYGQYIVTEQYRPGWAQVAPPLYFDNAITPIKDDGYSWTNSYAQVGQLPYEYTAIELEMNVHHDNVGELHMWLETPGDGVTPGVRVPLTWTSQRDIQDRRTAEYRGYGFGVAQGDLLDLEDLGSTKFITRSDAGDIELAGALGVTEVSSSELSSPVDPFDLSSTTAIASKYQLDVPIDPKNPLEVAGQWRLIIEDVEQGNAGELLDWTLHFYGKENEKTSYPGGVNRNPLQTAGVRTSYVVDMSAPDEAAMKLDGVDKEMSISLDTPSRSYYHFANYELVGDISGTKWHDADGDGKQGDNEQGVSGVKIYLDQNGNGQWDYTDFNLNGQWDANLDENHEPFVYTDAEGNYTFVNVPIGEHTVREDTTDYWQTYPHLLYSENFEGEINKQFDATWNSDTAAKDTLHPHLAPSGVTSFLGDFENDKVELRLNDLPKHQNLRVGFDVYVLGSWDGNHQHQGGDQFRFSANGSSYLVDTSFSNHRGVVGDSDTTISWQNPDNPFDVEVTTTPGVVTEKDTETLFDYVVKHGAVDLSIADSNAITSQGYLDVTGDGFISPRDIISVFNFVNAAAEAEDDNTTKYESILSFTQSFGLDEMQQPILLANEQQFAPGTGAVRTADFGNHSTDRPLPLEILSGVSAHNTLGYDMYGRNAQETDQFLPADTTYHFEIEINHDASDLVLEFEALGLTNDGKTNFEKWGIDNIRVLMDHHVVTVQPDQVVTDVDFGNQELPDYSVSGTKYLKVRENQIPLSGVTIYADLNNNDQWDEGEPKDVTRADDPEAPGNQEGTYHLTGIRQTPVTIREMPYGAIGPLLPLGGEHFVTFEKDPHAQGYDFLNARFGSVSGLKWNDANADGKYTAGEEFLEGVNIGLDLDSDGSIDEVTQTDSTGHYLFHYVRPGDHQVVEYVPSGWEPTLPADGKISFSNEIGENVSNLNFGNQRIQVVTGTKYIPGEQGGKDNQVGAAGFTIYADLNDNQNLDQGEPSTQTLHDNPLTDQNEAGFYQLSGFGDRTSVVIRELEKSDWLLVSPEGGRHIVDLSDGSDKTAIDFYNVPTGIVSGFKWHDLDSDGVWTAKEPAIKDWQITLDVNGDDKVDFITLTDSNGYYQASVPAGSVTIGEILPSPWQQTYPVENGKHTVHVNHGMHLKDLNFGNVNPEQRGEGDGKVKVFTGVLFHDVNNDGKLEPNVDAPLNNWTVYADLNKNDLLDNADLQVKSNESGDFIIELDPGEVTELGIRVAAPQGWIVSSPVTGEYLLNISESDHFSGIDFLSVEGATVSGFKWGDENLDARWDGSEKGLSGWEIRLDLGADGDGGYDLSTVTNESGYYEFSNLPSGTHRIFEVHQEGWHQTAPETVSHTVSVTPGKTYSDRNFGNFQQVVITGKKTDKTTGNGVAGVSIYADLNNDGNHDPGEPMAVTANDVPATTSIDETGDYKLYVMRHDSLKIREIVPAGWTLSEPSTGHHDLDTSTVSRIDNVHFVNVQDSGSISGSKWNDLDGDGVWDENEPALSGWTIQLDIGQNGTIDRTVLTNSEGNYTFTGLDAGRYQVSEDQKQGWKRTFPLEPAHPVTLATGQSVVGINFGNQLDDPAGSIAGTKWNDVDADGIWDAGEPRLQGWVIQLDIGRDGKVDRTTTTDANGDYVFGDLAAGKYYVSEIQQPGWERIYPVESAHPVTLAVGQNMTGINFGNHQDCEVHGRKTGIHGDVGIPGVQIYADINGNGQYDPNEPATLTSFDDPATDKDETGFYSLTGLPCNPVTIREILPAGWAVYSPDNGKHDVDFGNRSIVTDLDFRNYQLGTIYGYKRYDSDVELEGLFAADGSLDKGLDGWEIQIDYDWGGTGSPFVVDATVVTQADNPDTEIDEEGLYVFDNVPPGMHLIREVLKTGWTQTFPLSGEKENGQNYIVHIAGSEVKGSYDFGNVSDLTVEGDKLDYESKEPLAGFVIYADSNDNGVLDEGEVSTTTASDGSYRLTGIDQNTVNIRELQQDDYLQREPRDAYAVNFSDSTTTVRGLDFYNQSILRVPDGDDEIHIFGGDDFVYGDNEIDKTNPDFEKFVSTGSRNDTYAFEQVVTTTGTALGPDEMGLDEKDTVFDYTDEGDDTITFETLYSYHGDDVIDFNNPSVTLDLSLGIPSVHEIAGDKTRTIEFGNDGNIIERIVGSTEDDHLIGNAGKQVLVGHLGSDTLEAKGRDDTYKFYNNFEVDNTVSYISGITGVTREPVASKDETDTIVEAGGVDTLDLSDLNDSSNIDLDLNSPPVGTNTHYLDDSGLLKRNFVLDPNLEVFITGNVLNVSVIGNANAQTFIGGGNVKTHPDGTVISSTTIFDGRAGDDSFIINAGAAGGEIQVDGGAGNDAVDFSGFDADFVHQINGTSSSSESPDGTMMTFEEVEVLSGSQGDDHVHFKHAGGFAFGAGKIYGNAGLNTLDYSEFLGGSVVVNLQMGTATGTAAATDFDNVIGSEFDDVLIGSDGANLIVGGPGHDILSGLVGPDTYKFDDDGVALETDAILEFGSTILSTNIIDIRETMEDVVVAGGAGSIVQGTQRTINVAGMNNIGELRTGSGNDSIELWDTADAGFMYSLPWGGLHWWSDGLRVYGGEGDDSYIVPSDYSTQVGIIESFDPIDNATNEVIPSVDTLDLSARFSPTNISLNEFTAVDPFGGGYAIRLYDTNSSEAGTIGSVDLEGYSLFENVITGSGDDIIFGNDGDNLIDSGNGSDVVYGLAGADEIVMHGANGETNLVAGGAGDDLYRLQGDFSSGPDNRIFEAGASMTPGTGKLTPGGNDTIELEALGSNCIYVNLQGDVAEDLEDCDGDDISVAAGTVGMKSPGLAYREVLSLHGELMPIVDFDKIHSIHDLQTEISTSGDIYDSNGRFVENVLGTSTGQNWIWANGADNILTGGQQADTFTAIRGGDHFVHAGAGDDTITTGPEGFWEIEDTNGKAIHFDSEVTHPATELDGALILVVDLDLPPEWQLYEFDNDGTDLNPATTRVIPIDDTTELTDARDLLRDAIEIDFSRFDSDPLTETPSVEVVGMGLGLAGDNLLVSVTNGTADNLRAYDLDHLYEHQAGERVIGNNVLIGGAGADDIFSHDGSDLILPEEDTLLDLLGADPSARQKLDLLRALNDGWRFDDEPVETRLANTNWGDYLTDDGDVDQVRLDSGYEIDLPEEEWSKGVDVFFGDISQILDVDEMSPEEDDLVNELP